MGTLLLVSFFYPNRSSGAVLILFDCEQSGSAIRCLVGGEYPFLSYRMAKGHLSFCKRSAIERRKLIFCK